MVVERRERTVNWRVLIPAIVIIVIVVTWSLLSDFASEQLESIKQTERNQVKEDSKALPRDDKNASGFEDVLHTALRYDREGKRVLAATLFKELLSQAAQNPGYNEEVARLLPRAADFFRRGNEIPKEQVEILYQDAYLAIKQVHGPDYYDYENVHRGLEKHYLAQGRFTEAALQTRMLLEFYRRYHKNNKDAQYALMQPTMVRLGNNLLAAGQHADARRVYKSALRMARAKGGPVKAIETFIRRTYEDEKAAPASGTEAAGMPASMGGDISLVIPATRSTDNELKKAIRALSANGIHIEQLRETDNDVTIVGYADDNKAVGKYMQLIQKKISAPALDWVRRGDRDQKTISEFSIRLKK